MEEPSRLVMPTFRPLALVLAHPACSAGAQIPYRMGSPRVGDLACVYADPTRARDELGWKAKFGLEVR